MPHAPDVLICEVGPRDGLQNLDVFVPTEAKCALIDTIAAAGMREIDAGSFVPPKVVPQFADVDAVMAHALAHRTATIGALGAERAKAPSAPSPPVSTPSTSSSPPARRTTAQRAPLDRTAARRVSRGPRRDRRLSGGPSAAPDGPRSTAFGCSLEGEVERSGGAPGARAPLPRPVPTRSASPTPSATPPRHGQADRRSRQA